MTDGLMKINMSSFSDVTRETIKDKVDIERADGKLSSGEAMKLAEMLRNGEVYGTAREELTQLFYENEAFNARAELTEPEAQRVEKEMKPDKHKKKIDSPEEYEVMKGIATGEGSSYSPKQRAFAAALLMRDEYSRNKLIQDGLIEKVESLLEENAELKSENAELSAENQRLLKELDEKDTKIAEIETALAEKEKELETLGEKNETLLNEIASLKTSIASYKKQAAALRNQANSCSTSESVKSPKQLVKEGLEKLGEIYDDIKKGLSNIFTPNEKQSVNKPAQPKPEPQTDFNKNSDGSTRWTGLI